MTGRLNGALLDLDMDAAMESARGIAGGGSAASAEDGINSISEALRIAGKRFQDGEWFVAELVYASEIAKAAMDLLVPLMTPGTTRRLGTIVAGTVAGDLHDLGKNIFGNYAKGAGFDVIDLGVDVPKKKFVEAAERHQPLALGMSCLLTVTAAEVGNVIEELRRQGIRDNLKVIIGGAALTERFAREVGADAFAPDAVTGTDIVKRWSASP